MLHALILATCLLIGGPVVLTNAQGSAVESGYLDDRSTPESVLESYVSALNLKEYARAYSYWEPQAAAAEAGDFEDFQRGFMQTDAVQLTTGAVTGSAGAGHLYFAVPVFLLATMSDGSTAAFVGCYWLHLAQPLLQITPPFEPMGIQRARTSAADVNADRDALLSGACAQTSHT